MDALHAHEAASEIPVDAEDLGGGLLVGKDSRGLYPEHVPDRVILRQLKALNPRLRVLWNRLRGRFEVHEATDDGYVQTIAVYERANDPIVEHRYGPDTLAFTVESPGGRYQPLDHRVVSRLRLATYMANVSKSAEDYDAKMAEAREALIAAREEDEADDRKAMLREDFSRFKRSWDEGTFFSDQFKAEKAPTVYSLPTPSTAPRAPGRVPWQKLPARSTSGLTPAS